MMEEVRRGYPFRRRHGERLLGRLDGAPLTLYTDRVTTKGFFGWYS